MAESEENVALADSAVSTSSEAVASTRTASETHYNIRNYCQILPLAKKHVED